MKSGVEGGNRRYEYYVQIDGNVAAGCRAFVEALKVGLLLKQLRPYSDIKVLDAEEQSAPGSMQLGSASVSNIHFK
jgi:hypothetical protein